MSVDAELADRCIDLLNEILDLDPLAIEALINRRVPVNADLADHPTIQVGPMKKDGPPLMGLLGVLNGLCGVYEEEPKIGQGMICAVYDDAFSELLCFERIRKLSDEIKEKDPVA